MNRILVIARNTFRETLRDKILYNLVFFALLMIGSAVLLGSLAMGEQGKIIKDIGLAGINLFGVLIAIFVGISLVSKEIEKRTIYSIIAKPIRRYEFLLGRYSGLVMTLFVNTAIMAAGFFLTLFLSHMEMDPALLKAIGLIVVELLVITAVAVMFSTFTTPILSATFSLSLYVIGHLTDDLRVLGGKLQHGLTKQILDGLYYALPNLEYFNVKGQAVYGLAIEPSYLVSAVAYGVTYCAVVLILACMIFQRREFK
jgi:ABC-type transport system involved in multi-copper enzyme maturation permease subunit